MQLSTERAGESMGKLIEKPALMVLCQGHTAEEKPFWAYLCLTPLQAEHFYQARKRGAVNLEDYGTILEWGEGKEPSAEVRQRMREQYGMRDDFEDMLLKIIEQRGVKQ